MDVPRDREQGTGGAAVPPAGAAPPAAGPWPECSVLLIRQVCLSSWEGMSPQDFCGGFAVLAIRDVASVRSLLGERC